MPERAAVEAHDNNERPTMVIKKGTQLEKKYHVCNKQKRRVHEKLTYVICKI